MVKAIRQWIINKQNNETTIKSLVKKKRQGEGAEGLHLAEWSETSLRRGHLRWDLRRWVEANCGKVGIFQTKKVLKRGKEVDVLRKGKKTSAKGAKWGRERDAGSSHRALGVLCRAAQSEHHPLSHLREWIVGQEGCLQEVVAVEREKIRSLPDILWREPC